MVAQRGDGQIYKSGFILIQAFECTDQHVLFVKAMRQAAQTVHRLSLEVNVSFRLQTCKLSAVPLSHIEVV